jgi:hypothetical protein
MQQDELDIMFVPVYLQAHFLLKAIFWSIPPLPPSLPSLSHSGVYVSFYQDDWTRVVILTAINIALLILNGSTKRCLFLLSPPLPNCSQMKPCSVQSVNVARDTFFVAAALSGLQSLNYIANASLSGDASAASSRSTKALFLSTIITNVLFVHIGPPPLPPPSPLLLTRARHVCLLCLQPQEHQVPDRPHSARPGLAGLPPLCPFSLAPHLPSCPQLSQGGSVHPRVLEPLISLTLSSEPNDLEIGKAYIKELVNLIAYPNIRVQFQSAWGLANLGLGESLPPPCHSHPPCQWITMPG